MAALTAGMHSRGTAAERQQRGSSAYGSGSGSDGSSVLLRLYRCNIAHGSAQQRHAAQQMQWQQTRGGAGSCSLDCLEAHLMSNSPRLPVNWPSMYSSVLASCRFLYESTDTR